MSCIDEEERKLLLSLIENGSTFTKEQKQGALNIKKKLLRSTNNSNDNCEKVVTLGKVVNVKTYFGTRLGLMIVLPEEADLAARKLSVFSIIGSAIYGEKEGTVVPWLMDGELELIEITRVIT